jgi:hypothetical protein
MWLLEDDEGVPKTYIFCVSLETSHRWKAVMKCVLLLDSEGADCIQHFQCEASQTEYLEVKTYFC